MIENNFKHLLNKSFAKKEPAILKFALNWI